MKKQEPHVSNKVEERKKFFLEGRRFGILRYEDFLRS